MIRDALAPRKLAELRKTLEQHEPSAAERAAQLDEALRVKADADAESEDRQRHAAKLAAKLKAMEISRA